MIKKSALLVALAYIVNLMVYYGSKALNGGMPHVSMEIPADEAVPVISWTILIYVSAFFFWAVNYFLASVFDKSGFNRLIVAHCIGEAVCFLFFIILPTTMLRPEITGTSVFDRLLSFVYSSDVPTNLFPSIHCFMGWLCWIGVRGNEKVPRWYQIFSLILAIAICISTLTVKQHVIVDVPSGVLLAELSYFIAKYFEKFLRHDRKDLREE